jgi:hypothetical protein
MLVCLQFESIGRRKRQDGRPGLDGCNVLPHLIVSRTISAAAHSDYERVTARTVAELEDGVRPLVGWFEMKKAARFLERPLP